MAKAKVKTRASRQALTTAEIIAQVALRAYFDSPTGFIDPDRDDVARVARAVQTHIERGKI